VILLDSGVQQLAGDLIAGMVGLGVVTELAP
jgi:hypothetical protein